VIDQALQKKLVPSGRLTDMNASVVLGLRVDQRTISRAILRARLDQLVAEKSRERANGKVGREERARLTKAIESELMTRSVPATAMNELAWFPRERAAWFSSTAQRANEEMMELFEKTFGLRLVPLVPLTLAERFIDAQGKGGGALDRANPTDLRPRP